MSSTPQDFSPSVETTTEELCDELRREFNRLGTGPRHTPTAKTTLIRLVSWIEELPGEYTLAIVSRETLATSTPPADCVGALADLAREKGLAFELRVTGGVLGDAGIGAGTEAD